MSLNPPELDKLVRRAVSSFWRIRFRQAALQKTKGSADQGDRAAVTGGAQMNGFARLICKLVKDAGIPDAMIFRDKSLELPGYFRPTKKWDILVVVDGVLLAAVEAKSQVGPSFGNNFNNRSEEAIGSAVDLWSAFREGAFAGSPRPWVGYLFLLEDCEKSRAPLGVAEPHFPVFPEFKNSSYMKRYELLCRKLVRERHYEAAAFLVAQRTGKGAFVQPADDLSFSVFAASLVGHVSAIAAARGKKR
ncbi:MAG: PaeR7I family type II restriction endonuclease [Planctomycetaceae bacterium]|nr:PaeR7I family type II restriction endonuclease [Planctomycetaceae bacterium]